MATEDEQVAAIVAEHGLSEGEARFCVRTGDDPGVYKAMQTVRNVDQFREATAKLRARAEAREEALRQALVEAERRRAGI